MQKKTNKKILENETCSSPQRNSATKKFLNHVSKQFQEVFNRRNNTKLQTQDISLNKNNEYALLLQTITTEKKFNQKVDEQINRTLKKKNISEISEQEKKNQYETDSIFSFLLKSISKNQKICIKFPAATSRIFQLIARVLIQLEEKPDHIYLITSSFKKDIYDTQILNIIEQVSETDLEKMQKFKNSQMIKIISFEQITIKELTSISKNGWIFFDVHNQDIFLYEPTYLKITQLKFQKLIIYTDYVVNFPQIEEVIEIDDRYPYEIISLKNQKQQIAHIIKQSNLYAQKIDIIIFTVNDQYPQQLIDFLKSQRLHANVIFSSEMKYSPFLINIFIAKSEETLSSWRLSLADVVAVFDFGMRSEYYFDISLRTYMEKVQQAYNIEIIRRFNILGNKPSKYYKLYTHRPQSNKKYFKLSKIPFYVLKMLELDFSVDIIKSGKQNILYAIEKSIEQFILQNILIQKKIDSRQIIQLAPTLQITSTKFTSYYNKIIPFFNKILQESILNKNFKLANMIVYAISFLMTPGSMISRSDKKFNQFWRKSGELQVYTQILYIYESMFVRTSKNIKHQDLSHKESQSDLSQMFGSIFQEFKPKQKLTVSKMDYSTFIKEYGINAQYLEVCYQKVHELRKIFQFQFQELNSIDIEIEQLIPHLFKNFKLLAFYTGSRRFGYQIMKFSQKFIPSKKSLIGITNERYNMIIPLRIRRFNGEYEIQMCNKISEQLYLIFASDLQIINRKSSFSQSQIQFHNIGTGLFQILWKNDGQYIIEFQRKFDCIVQFNEQLSAIIIFCSKITKTMVEKQFQEAMNKAKKQLLIETKLIQYHGKKLIFQKGGRIREILQKTQGRILHLVNLADTISQAEVRQLLQDQIGSIQKLQLRKSEKIKNSKQAIITFETYEDLIYVFNVLNYTQFNGRKIRFERNQIKAQEINIVAENYVKIKWYAWKSKKNAKIQYKHKQAALKAVEAFKKHDNFDKNKIKIIQKEESIYLEGINEITDQIFIYNSFSIYGPIVNIQIQKNPLQQKSNYENLLEFYIKQNIPKNERFHIVNIQKKSRGLRVAKVKFPNQKCIPILCNSLNQRIKLIGETRIYVIPYYKHPYLIQKSMQKLYNQFFSEIYKNNQMIQSKIKTKVIQKNNMLYAVVKSNNEAAFNIFTTQLALKIKPIPLNLFHEEKSIILCEMGMQSLEKIENKFNCKFFPNIIKKELSVVCQDKYILDIMKQIRSIPLQIMTLSVVTSMKTFRLLIKKQNQEKLEEIKIKNNLNIIKIDKIGKCILMEGKIINLQSAKQNLTFLIQSFCISKELLEQNMSNYCGICCQQLSHPYRLQACSHVFCLECLMFSINNSLQDVNMFPIRCPHCLQQLIIKDLQNLLDDHSWNRLQNISINDYVNRNSHMYMFCYSANCPGIYKTASTEFQCKICQKTYCTKCKQDKHPGMTCQQAKEGTSALLKKYMQQNDVRICPNTNCKMLMQRVDGCYRVTCSRCQQSMCWKCPRDKMPIYVTADQCYKHLTKEHGGYW